MFNATLVGRLGKDAEARTTSGGQAMTTFTVATDHGWGDKKRTTWTRVVAFGKQAEFAAKLTKGDRVAVSGDVYLDEWQDREGGKRQTLTMDARSVELLRERQGGGEEPAQRRQDGGGAYRGGRRDDPAPTPSEPDEEIPF